MHTPFWIEITNALFRNADRVTPKQILINPMQYNNVYTYIHLHTDDVGASLV